MPITTDNSQNASNSGNGVVAVGKVYIDQFSKRNSPFPPPINDDSVITSKDIDRIVGSIRDSFSDWIEIQRQYYDSDRAEEKKNSLDASAEPSDDSVNSSEHHDAKSSYESLLDEKLNGLNDRLNEVDNGINGIKDGLEKNFGEINDSGLTLRAKSDIIYYKENINEDDFPVDSFSSPEISNTIDSSIEKNPISEKINIDVNENNVNEKSNDYSIAIDNTVNEEQKTVIEKTFYSFEHEIEEPSIIENNVVNNYEIPTVKYTEVLDESENKPYSFIEDDEIIKSPQFKDNSTLVYKERPLTENVEKIVEIDKKSNFYDYDILSSIHDDIESIISSANASESTPMAVPHENYIKSLVIESSEKTMDGINEHGALVKPAEMTNGNYPHNIISDVNDTITETIIVNEHNMDEEISQPHVLENDNPTMFNTVTTNIETVEQLQPQYEHESGDFSSVVKYEISEFSEPTIEENVDKPLTEIISESSEMLNMHDVLSGHDEHTVEPNERGTAVGDIENRMIEGIVDIKTAVESMDKSIRKLIEQQSRSFEDIGSSIGRITAKTDEHSKSSTQYIISRTPSNSQLERLG